MKKIFRKLFLLLVITAMVVTSGIPVTDIQAAAASKVTLDKNSLIIGIGKFNAKNLKATVTGSKKDIVFESSNKKVATVTQSGRVTGISVGKATITCQISGTKAKASCKVTVREFVKTVSMSDPYINFYTKGETYQIKVDIAPSNATMKDVSYSIRDDSVATVNSKGLVTAVGPGSTTITAMANDGSKKCILIKVKFVDGKYDAPVGFDANRKVEHGEVKEISYYSSVTETERPALVYTPPGYSKDKKYNVVYLLHGHGCDQNQWYSDGACNILDNLYAKGDESNIKDMILVMPNSNIEKSVDGITDQTANFEKDLINCLMPYIAENYSIETGRDHTAICGLSMGGGQTCSIGFDRLDLFAYMAILSAAPSDRLAKFTANLESETNKLYPPKVIWVSVGSADTLVANSIKNYRSELEKPEVQQYFKDNNTVYAFYEMPTTIAHSYPEWNNGLYNFAQMIFK